MNSAAGNPGAIKEKLLKGKDVLFSYIKGEAALLKQTAAGYRPWVKAFLIILAIYLVGISSILRADFNYVDDLGRVLDGYHAWHGAFSRYTSTAFAILLHGDTYLSDISPLGQIVAAIILSVAAVIMLKAFSENDRLNPWSIAAAIPLGLSPYFLECLSYKYDSPYMALSVLAGFIPLVFTDFRKPTYFLAVFFSTLLMCTTYQAASGIFPVVVIFYCLVKWNRGGKIKEQLRFALLSAAGYIAGMLFFMAFIMKRTEDSYVSGNTLPLSEMGSGFIKNLTRYVSNITTDFKTLWLVLIALTAVGFVYVMVRDSRQNRWVSLAASLVAVPVTGALCFGAYLILSHPIFQPRGMFGFGAFLALMAVVVLGSEKKYLPKLACVALCWCFFSFGLMYGNALAQQQEYTDFRIQLVIDDLNELELMNSDAEKTICLDGDIGHSPVIENNERDYEILDRLIPKTFGGNPWAWNGYYFYYYFGLENVKRNPTTVPPRPVEELTLLKETMYHDIYADGDYILIKIK